VLPWVTKALVSTRSSRGIEPGDGVLREDVADTKVDAKAAAGRAFPDILRLHAERLSEQAVLAAIAVDLARARFGA
jgi:hypothetical protein